ncbi:MAG: hydroxyphenylacetyl-CoA thioesterase PaaI [Paracoccus hibiscisoli]|uniref:hydroxyphenylacetyl-CoA thioesterase PaaI n=1 Tax=Paracoccus hibiscisoli TaxID=2023261 RepID=UPI003919966C
MTDDDLARACAAAMWAQDVASQRLGMVLEDVGPGRAVLSMTIMPDMVNGHGTAHGGFIFALADSAFAFACNTVDQRSVGQQASITYLAPARAGERLTATATERARQGRSGLYDVTVTGADGTLIAEFRGHSRTVKGRILAD